MNKAITLKMDSQPLPFLPLFYSHFFTDSVAEKTTTTYLIKNSDITTSDPPEKKAKKKGTLSLSKI